MSYLRHELTKSSDSYNSWFLQYNKVEDKPLIWLMTEKSYINGPFGSWVDGPHVSKWYFKFFKKIEKPLLLRILIYQIYCALEQSSGFESCLGTQVFLGNCWIEHSLRVWCMRVNYTSSSIICVLTMHERNKQQKLIPSLVCRLWILWSIIIWPLSQIVKDWLLYWTQAFVEGFRKCENN